MMEKIRTYKTAIVDDNEIDRLTTLVLARKHPFLDIVGAFSSSEEAIRSLDGQQMEVLLLDIDMPGMNGLSLRKELGPEPVCIFITSFPDYAIDGFDLAALDFLIKPLEKDRFDASMARLQDFLTIKHKAALFECSHGADAVFIKDGHDQVKIFLHEIIYLEALKDYTRIVTANKKYCVLSVLGSLLQQKAFTSFVRIHRSYAVQKHFVNRVTALQVYLNDISLPVGRTYKSELGKLSNTE
jgi:DNA-binding LytR/AlgR family response regulator